MIVKRTLILSVLLIALVSVGALLLGCEKSGADAAPAEKSATSKDSEKSAASKEGEKTAQANPTPAEPAAKADPIPSVDPTTVEGMVEVAATGTRFEPAAEKSQIPEGTWMCDMGTVHYAAHAPGTCPLCKMKLVEKGGDGAAPAMDHGKMGGHMEH